jgi:hypothetical protein
MVKDIRYITVLKRKDLTRKILQLSCNIKGYFCEVRIIFRKTRVAFGQSGIRIKSLACIFQDEREKFQVRISY